MYLGCITGLKPFTISSGEEHWSSIVSKADSLVGNKFQQLIIHMYNICNNIHRYVCTHVFVVVSLVY